MKNFENSADAIKMAIESLPSSYVEDVNYDDTGRILSYTNAVYGTVFEYEYISINGISYVKKIHTTYGSFAYVYDSNAGILAVKTPWTVTIGTPTKLNMFMLESSEGITPDDIKEVDRYQIPESMGKLYGGLTSMDVRFFTKGRYEDGRHFISLDIVADEYNLVIYEYIGEDTIMPNDCSDLIA